MEIYNKLKSKGKTILLTTHYIEEAEKLCDRICFVSKGRIVLSETKKKIMKEFKQKRLEDNKKKIDFMKKVN